ncbi:sensor histidine kinase [Microbacterium oxydans]|uniref:histidine kinase n=1 Tax=Microbacterium oxydans TaxID=82380 RepID=A0A0F0L3M2_9MICO|nr:sensor histidine kinase [Microbacterium oxydans]KJL27728.1 Sensor histidine kinase LiaS [Microbacterium oxydans]
MASRRQRAPRVPREARTPRARRIPWLTRRTGALGALGAATIALFATLVPLQTNLSGTPLALSFILGAAACGAPLLSLSRPRIAIAVFCVSTFMLSIAVDTTMAISAPWPWSVPALLTFVLLVGVVTFQHGGRLGAFALITGVISSLLAPLIRPDMVATAASSGSATADLIVTSSVAVAMYVIAALVAGRVRLGAELTREREHSALEESRRALVEERTRIARELHDVVAHSMSVIQVQASTARYRLPEIGDVAASEFDDIAATARTSLAEMRRMLGVLRTEDQSAELAPQHGIDDIPALVDSIRRAGVDVGLAIEGGGAASLAMSSVQIATFRIVQEALSNAVRHSPGSRVVVRVQVDERSILVRVHNAASSTTSTETGGGYGLRGMRERAELLGGSLSAGPDRDGGWTVEATLPLLFDVPTTPADPPASPEKEPL